MDINLNVDGTKMAIIKQLKEFNFDNSWINKFKTLPLAFILWHAIPVF